MIITKPKPARHHDLTPPYYERTGRQIEPQEQGFLTSDGEYVGREKAARIAVIAGQIERPTYGLELFSEDLW